MTEQQLDKKQLFESEKSKDGKMEIDFLDVIHSIVRIRKTLYMAAGVGVIIGIVVALSIPKRYTVEVTLSPEVGNPKGNTGLVGLAASFLGNGTTMGEGSDALNVSLSSDIVSSTPFLLELFGMNVDRGNKNTNTNLEVYLDEQTSPWWNYLFSIPGTIVGGVKSLVTGDKASVNTEGINQTIIELTKEEVHKIALLKRAITVSVDKTTAITSISVTLQDPKVAAIVADSVVHKLQEYIINYRISKAKEDCLYLENLFKERQQEYYVAQKKYADYIDSHDNVILQSVRAEQERLQNEMNLSYQVYSQVANQLQIARAKVQEEKPVFAVVEPPVVPLVSSGITAKMYILLFLFLAVISTASWILIGKVIWNNLRKMRTI